MHNRKSFKDLDEDLLAQSLVPFLDYKSLIKFSILSKDSKKLISSDLIGARLVEFDSNLKKIEQTLFITLEHNPNLEHKLNARQFSYPIKLHLCFSLIFCGVLFKNQKLIIFSVFSLLVVLCAFKDNELSNKLNKINILWNNLGNLKNCEAALHIKNKIKNGKDIIIRQIIVQAVRESIQNHKDTYIQIGTKKNR